MAAGAAEVRCGLSGLTFTPEEDRIKPDGCAAGLRQAGYRCLERHLTAKHCSGTLNP